MIVQLSTLNRETTGLKLFPPLTLMGWILVGFSILVCVIILAPTAAAYWSGNAKATRDASLELAQLALSPARCLG
jgi:hypothetical protein